MTIAIVGDIHLGKISADQIKKDKIFESQNLFFNFFRKYCTDNNIKEIIWTGDIFDNNRNVDSSIIQYGVNLFNDMFGDCEHHDILGNHCLYERGNLNITSLTCIEHLRNVHLYKKPTKVNLLGHKFLFVPYLVPSLYDKFANNIEKLGRANDVVVGHFDIIGATMENGSPSKVGLDMNKLLDNFKLIISGHYHNISKYTRGSNKIQYVGSPYQMTFGDASQIRGFWTIDDNLNLKFIENPVSYKFMKITDNLDFENTDLKKYFIECSYSNNISDEDLYKLNKKLEQSSAISYRTVPKEISNISELCEENSEDTEKANEISEAINLGDMLKVCDVYKEVNPPMNNKIVDRLLLDIQNRIKDKAK